MSGFLRWCVLAAAAAIATPSGAQESYPSRPVRLLVGVAPGSTADVSLRILAQKLSQILGGQFVVENRTGAGTSIAAQMVSRLALRRPGWWKLFGRWWRKSATSDLAHEAFSRSAGSPSLVHFGA